MLANCIRFRLIVSAAAALALAGCDTANVSIDGHAGVTLAQLALKGQDAREITLLGPDTVHIVHGDKLDIHVEGDARAVGALRFVLIDGKLGIGRRSGTDTGNGTATITITDPAVDHLIMAGSGTMSADRLSGQSVGVTIGGSGHVVTAGIGAREFGVEVLGSGSFTGSGHADKLVLTLAGSGDVDLAQLKAGEAAIDVAGSGTGVLSSDGPVTGTVVGSGEITVHGKAHCAANVTGSGKITCQP
jgi:hypothetical protein